MEKAKVDADRIRVKMRKKVVCVCWGAVSGAPNSQPWLKLELTKAILTKDVDIRTPLCRFVNALGGEPVVIARSQQHRNRLQASECRHKEIGCIWDETLLLIKVASAGQQINSTFPCHVTD